MAEYLENVFPLAEKWMEEGRHIAIATVIKTWGSSPRPVGSQLLLDSRGNFEGSVSGGCVETAVIEEGLQVIEQKKAKLLEYGVSNEMAWEVGLACGGSIRVYVEAVTE